MNEWKMADVFKRALLIEDSPEICEFYRDFFEAENLTLDVLHAIPEKSINVSDTYDILICDWLVGIHSAKNWIQNLVKRNKLPLVTIVATGMLGIEDQIAGLPIQLVYKPFDFVCLKDVMLNAKRKGTDQAPPFSEKSKR